MVAIVKGKVGYDDSLDAFGVHGVGGTLGAILTGVFATRLVNSGLKDAAGNPQPLGLVDGNASQIVNQIIGSAMAIFRSSSALSPTTRKSASSWTSVWLPSLVTSTS